MSEITIASIRDGLSALGLEKGDRVVMHSSLQRLAKARELTKLPNCGGDLLVDAFLEHLGAEGLLCVPVFTSTFTSPSSGPVGEIFDPQATPSRVGSVTNLVLQRDEAVRSLHPTHSWAAIGNDAAELVEGHDKTSTFGRDSICGRMYDWDFKVVWFGTTGTTNTSTHFAEDWLNLPYMTSEDALVKEGDGFRSVTVYRSPNGPRNFYKDGCPLDSLLAGWDIQKTTRIHSATVKVMQHRTFMAHLLKAMINNPCLLLKEDRDDAYHKQFYKLNSEHMEQLKSKNGGPEGILSALNIETDI
jgi:aminoglycoside 3-N-acetyltransferase